MAELKARIRACLKKALKAFEILMLVVVASAAVYGALRYVDDTPVVYEGDEAHFKHGSTGGERGWKKQFGFGFPYWIWVAMPELFPQYVPDGNSGSGYRSFGMVYEDGTNPKFDLPIGMSMRRVMGVDRVYFNCALCHTGTVRKTPGGQRDIILGMPANTFDLGAIVQFINDTSGDWRFTAPYLMPKIEELAKQRDAELPADDNYRPDAFGIVDRQIFSLLGVSMMRDQMVSLVGQLDHMDHTLWGPGRVDTFNAPKALLGFRMDTAHERELIGIADFPSIWNQRARTGMSLHWDGNNCSVDERNLSAGYGTGATPATLDRDKLLRVADWLAESAQPAEFPSEHIDEPLVAEGKDVYEHYCVSCHGAREAPYRTPDSRVGEVVAIDEIGTDRARLDSYTPELAKAQSSIYAGFPEGSTELCREYDELVCNAERDEERYLQLREMCYPSRFTHFRKTNGYANMPLDGIWLRAPYLHNGSVPTLRELLEPASNRRQQFFTGYDVYDFDNVGFISTGDAAASGGWFYDTRLVGNGNGGHEGAEYGTELNAGKKQALLEYLKTF